MQSRIPIDGRVSFRNNEPRAGTNIEFRICKYQRHHIDKRRLLRLLMNMV